MSWQKVNYRTARTDGTDIYFDGWQSGYFAYNFGLELTHLASGLKVGQFAHEEGCRKVAEYLTATFPDELAAVKAAIGRKKLSIEQIKKLPEMHEFLSGVSADEQFRSMVGELTFKKEQDESAE